MRPPLQLIDLFINLLKKNIIDTIASLSKFSDDILATKSSKRVLIGDSGINLLRSVKRIRLTTRIEIYLQQKSR